MQFIIIRQNVSRQRALTCQLSLQEVGKRKEHRPAESVQGQEGDSTLTDQLVIPRHVTPGNTGEPLFPLSILRSYCSSPTTNSDPELQPITRHHFFFPQLADFSFHPSYVSSNRLLDRHRRVADSPFATNMISHSMHEKEVPRSCKCKNSVFASFI